MIRSHRPAGQGPTGRLAAAVLAGLLLAAPVAAGGELRLAAWSQAPPIGAPAVALLARHLAAALGVAVRGEVASSALAHWEQTRERPRYQLAFDAAHFTGYRERYLGFAVLAKLAGATRYALVTAPATLATGLEDLVGRTLAVPPAPGLAGLLAARLFADPLRAPRLLAVGDFGAALRMLAGQRADAALLPLERVPAGQRGALLLESEAILAPAISAAPGLDAALRRRLAAALESAPPALLAALGTTRLERVAPGRYARYATLLEGSWGYRGAGRGERPVRLSNGGRP